MFDQLHNYLTNNFVEIKLDYLSILLQSTKDFSNYNTNNLQLLEAL